MGQWFKKKEKAQNERVLEFNVLKLKTEMQNLSLRIGAVQEELGVTIILEVINMAYNIQVLEANRYRDEKGIWVHQGRLQALSDLAHYIEAAKNAKPKEELEKNIPRGVLKTRRNNNQAMASI